MIEEACGCVPNYFKDAVTEIPACSGAKRTCMKYMKEFSLGLLDEIKDRGIFLFKNFFMCFIFYNIEKFLCNKIC